MVLRLAEGLTCPIALSDASGGNARQPNRCLERHERALASVTATNPTCVLGRAIPAHEEKQGALRLAFMEHVYIVP
jgi:hypothetical protein